MCRNKGIKAYLHVLRKHGDCPRNQLLSQLGCLGVVEVARL